MSKPKTKDSKYHATLLGHHDHDGLVLVFAKRYTWACKQGNLDMDDLVQAGRMGIMRAQETFDPERGLKFSTYASWWVRQSIARLCLNEGSTIRIPVYAQAERRAAGNVKTFFHRVSINHHNEEEDEMCLLDVVCPTESTADEDVEKSDKAERIRKALDRLPERERRVLYVRFFKEGTLEQAGDEFGVTRERARQIEARALQMLKAEMTGKSWVSVRKSDNTHRDAKVIRYRRLKELGFSPQNARKYATCTKRFSEALEIAGVDA